MDYLTGRTDNKDGSHSVKEEAAEISTDARIAQLEKMVAQLVNNQENK